jgi:hypothetical protein
MKNIFLDTPKHKLELLEVVLSAITLDDDDTINEATNIIDAWINNTIGVKGYCRT